MESPSSPLMPLGSKGHDRRRVTGKGKGTGGHITLLRPKNYTISCENLRHAPLHFPRVLALFSRGLGKRAEIPLRRRTTAAFVSPVSSRSAFLGTPRTFPCYTLPLFPRYMITRMGSRSHSENFCFQARRPLLGLPVSWTEVC